MRVPHVPRSAPPEAGDPQAPPVRPPDAPGGSPDAALRAIFDRTYQFVGLLAPDGTLLDVNRTALDFAGVERDTVVGLPFSDTAWWSQADTETLAQLRQAIADAARGEFVRYEVDVAGAHGRRATIDFSLTPVHDERGGVVGIIPEGRDITERRRAEEALRLSEAKFAGIVALAAEAIVSVDEHQRITLFNHAAEQMFGYASAEVLGESLDLLLPDAARGAHHGHVTAFGEAGPAARRMGERRPVYGRRRDGTLFPAEASISRLDCGTQRILTAVVRDVTERQHAEEERARLLRRETAARAAAEEAGQRARFLAEAGALLDESLDHRERLSRLARLAVPALATLCVVDLVDESGVRRVEVAHAEPALAPLARELLRFPRDPARAMVSRRSLATARAQLLEQVDDALLTRVAYDDEHLALLRRLELRSVMDVPLVARGSVIGAMIFATDAASGRRYGPADLALAEELARRAAQSLDNARLYEAARRATRLREEVLGIVSHDLRTPLSVVGMHVARLEQLEDELAEQRDESPAGHALLPVLHGVSEGIRESVDWLERMLQDLLDVASIDAGRLRLERRTRDPLLLVMHAVHLLEPLARAAGVTLRPELPEHLPEVDVDDDRMRQVLANLVGNALKFTPEGGTVTVGAREVGGRVTLFVRDTGPGIAPEHLARVFDRFWHERGAARVRGTGLGLAIAKGIVEAHGGSIRAESVPGEGSTFLVTLPASGAPGPRAPADAGAAGARRQPVTR